MDEDVNNELWQPVWRESLMGREHEDGDSVTNKWALFCFLFVQNRMTMGQYRFYREKYRL